MTPNQSAAEKVLVGVGVSRAKQDAYDEEIIARITALLDAKDREIAVLEAEIEAWRSDPEIAGFEGIATRKARAATDAMRDGRDAK